MYSVSQAYMESMAKNHRPDSHVELTLLNIDTMVQNYTYASGFVESPYSVAAGVTDTKQNDRRQIASFERDFMRADGTHIIPNGNDPDFQYYMSDAISSGTASSEGVYPITAGGVDIVFLENVAWQARPKITLITDGVVQHVVLTVIANNSTQVFSRDVEGNTITFDDLPNYTYYTRVYIRVTALNKPQRRIRIYKVYFGDVEVYTSNDVYGLDYVDINDTLMLELPQKTLRTEINNVHNLTTVTEYNNPRYIRRQTQLQGRIGYEVGGNIEWVPLGRWYLEDYEVSEKRIILYWISALEVINMGTHYFDKLSPCTVAQKIDNVMHINERIQSANGYVNTLPHQYNMSIDTSKANTNLQYTVTSAVPLVTPSSALQLCANFTGNRIHIERSDWFDFGLQDWNINANPVMTLYKFECYGDDVFENEGKPNTIVVGVTQRSPDITWMDLPTGMILDAFTAQYVFNKPITTIYFRPMLPFFVSVSQYSYCAFVRDTATISNPQYTMQAQINELVNFSQESRYGNFGEAVNLSNPLIDTAARGASYTSRMQRYLKNPIFLTRNHRGYIPLDAGDIITVDVDGKNVRALVVENRFSFVGGATSGTTKMRLLYDLT